MIEHTDDFVPDLGSISNIASIQPVGDKEMSIIDRAGEVFEVRFTPEPGQVWLQAAGVLMLAGLARARRARS